MRRVAPPSGLKAFLNLCRGDGQSLCHSPRKAFTTHRIIKIEAKSSAITTLAAAQGWAVASQVMPTAATSSLLLKAMFDTGSGLGVTNARAAVLDPCAAKAIAAPTAVASTCMPGVSWVVAR